MNNATATPAKRPTMATVKSFIKKNEGALFIDLRSRFDGMVDGCTERYFGFQQAQATERNIENTKGVEGAWFVGQSRDYITPYNANGFEGFEISNSCGKFILAVKVAGEATPAAAPAVEAPAQVEEVAPVANVFATLSPEIKAETAAKMVVLDALETHPTATAAEMAEFVRSENFAASCRRYITLMEKGEEPGGSIIIVRRSCVETWKDAYRQMYNDGRSKMAVVKAYKIRLDELEIEGTLPWLDKAEVGAKIQALEELRSDLLNH